MKKSLILYLFLTLSLTLQGNVYFKHLGKADGLPQISVMTICQDELGRMWFGTLEGLACYDGNSMTVHKPSPTNADCFLGNEIYNLVSDKQGNIFFTADNTFIRYDIHKEQFTRLPQHPNYLHVQGHDTWMASRDSVFKWNHAEEQFTFVYQLKSGKNIISLYSDNNECLWLGTSSGLYRIDNLENPAPVCVLAHVPIQSLYRDTKGRIWAAAFRQGMYKIENGISRKFAIEKDFAISDNDVRCFVEDNEGSIWVGTFNGLNKIDTLGNVSCYQKDSTPGSLRHSSVFALCKDSQGTIWVGTYYGGVHYFNPQTSIFRHYSEDAGRTDCLSSFFIGDMVEDKSGDIWICTEGGGLNYLNRKTRRFAHYLIEEGTSATSFYNLKCIEYDKKRHCLYIGTYKQGLLCFDIATRKIKSHTTEAGTTFSQISLRGDSLYCLSDKGILVRNVQTGKTEHLYPSIPEVHGRGNFTFLIDSKDNIWFAQDDQLVKVNMKKPEEKSVYRYNDASQGRFGISEMAEYPDGNICIGTFGAGIYVFNPQEGNFTHCSAFNIGQYYKISVTRRGYLAIANERGLLIYHPQTQEMKMIDAEHQLHLSSINKDCGLLVCRDGETFVGGTSGMTSFMSASLFNQSPQYNLYFSSLLVNDKSVSCQTTGHILSTALPFAEKIDLKYNENNISLTIASNSYIDNANRKIYEYRLDGFSQEWSTIYNNTIVYTNLNPGKYKLLVREKRQTSQDEIHSIALSITVHSPWWATWWAYTIYISIITTIGYFLLRSWRTRMQLRASLAQEKLAKEKNEELTQAKLQFFANISHEFRTPLTLIISQIESLMQSSGSNSPFLRTRLQKIYKNTFQFRELISELLDFRKMEYGKLNLHVCQQDMVLYLKQIHSDFMDQAQLQNIYFVFHSGVESAMCWCDGRQLRKVFSNLLSNAFKHTPEKGKIELQIHETATTLEIKVMDTGSGIPSEALPHIFDRFYQVDATVASPGSGIGLALSKGLVELHHGEIKVQSAMQYGTIFTVILPKDNPFQNDSYVTFVDSDASCLESTIPFAKDADVENNMAETPYDASDAQGDLTSKDSILVVEDNEDLLQILTSLLSPLYRVVIAMNGKEGLQKTIEEHPDLILSDIMMPEMSGIEMCSKIKGNFDLCHISVILLTALTSENNKMEGLQCGADDYIEKPFNNKMLLGHIANIIRNRKLLKQKFSKDLSATAETEAEIPALALNPIDAKFLSNLKDIVNEHLLEPEFDVNVLAQKLTISRSALYSKLRALSCMTPNEFILNARLKRAAELLKNNPELQITEIAYQTGFNSLRYFRHCFKASFNQTPQEYRVS